MFEEFLDENTPTCTTIDNGMILKNGLIDKSKRWTHFNVHPDQAYSKFIVKLFIKHNRSVLICPDKQEYQIINDASYTLMRALPCIKFGIWPPNSQPSGDYVRIIKGTNNGCNSYVGRQGGRQVK